MRWDLFCRVVDNHGDLGFCWRLASVLAARGEHVRLWVDDDRALAWMAPTPRARGVHVQPWTLAAPAEVGDVVIEAFGCDPPPAFVQTMAQQPVAPVWINLEYLSAEPYVERCHGLPSPQAGGLMKWFFYPGFTARSGGLLREPDLVPRMQGFDGRAWLAAQGWGARAGERVCSVFAYAHADLAQGLAHLAQPQPTLLLAAPGPAQHAARALPPSAHLRVVDLPWLTQPDYDRLLWACDLNAVRGEDSFVRAQWAAKPMLWHIYPQHDGAHEAKLEAWLNLLLQDAATPLADHVRQVQLAWNGFAPWPEACDAPVTTASAWHALQQAWRERLLALPELATSLLAFIAARRGEKTATEAGPPSSEC